MTHEEARSSSIYRDVNATRFIVSALGVLFALGGIDHGFFETLQGYTPTPGLIVQSIGIQNRMWVYGTEDAFTLIPNFLLSGIAAISVSLLIVVWSLRFVHRKHGSTVFLLLFVVLLLVGGGMAQVVYFTLGWAVSTRINRPLLWLKRILPLEVRRVLGGQWPWLLGGFALLSLIALEIAIAGYLPGITDPLHLLHACWWLLAAGLVLLLMAIASAFVHDVDRSQSANRRDWRLPE
jgi:hypothetical protein